MSMRKKTFEKKSHAFIAVLFFIFILVSIGYTAQVTLEEKSETCSLISYLGEDNKIEEIDIKRIYNKATYSGKNYIKEGENIKIEESTKAGRQDSPRVGWSVNEEEGEGFPIARNLLFTKPVRKVSDGGSVVNIICKFMFDTKVFQEMFVTIMINGFSIASTEAGNDDILAITIIDDNTSEVISCYINNGDFKKLKNMDDESMNKQFVNKILIKRLATEAVKYSEILNKSSEIKLSK